MTTTQFDHEVTVAPAFHNFGELRPYPSLLLLDYWLPGQTEPLATMSLDALRELARRINGGLESGELISIESDEGKTRLSAKTMRQRIRLYELSNREARLIDLVSAIQDLLAGAILVDKVLWEIRQIHGDLDPETLKQLRGKLRDKDHWSANYLAICEEYGLDPVRFRRRAIPEDAGTAAVVYDQGLASTALWYVEHRSPGWFDPTTRWLSDDLRQIVVVSTTAELAAIYASEARAKARIAAMVGAEHGPWCDLHRLSPGSLKAAFMQGPARTLWLRGIHRRTAAKPDSKILSGIDLESALDPLGDQSFYFSAARCDSWMKPDVAPEQYDPRDRHGRLSVGVAPHRSTVWAPAIPAWPQYMARVAEIVDRVEYVGDAESDALATLAQPVPRIARSEVWGAYDMSVIAPELLTDNAERPGTNPKAERWAYEAVFFGFKPDPNDEKLDPESVNYDKKLADPNFTVAVALEGNYLGRLALSFDIRDDRPIKMIATPEEWQAPTTQELGGYSIQVLTDDERSQLLDEACSVCEEPTWLTVRYDSGHTMSGRMLYSVQLRDTIFPSNRWLWRTFKDYDVHKEKPSHPSQIGKEDSLFCWVWNDWPADMPDVKRGWLACDDGPEEIADFIHFDPIDNLLTLIHVKASHSKSPNRQISTSDYEVVVGQAVKNLRLLDRVDLANRLQSGVGRDPEVLKAVWHGKQQSTRTEMAKALRNAGESYERRVVIIQPRVTASEHNQVMADRAERKNTGRVRRLKQLDTLLLEAQASCRHLGADFWVIGHSI